MRKLTPYEINHLTKHGFDPLDEAFIKNIEEKPVEYITGLAEFYGRNFIVNQNTLIPRIETENIIKIAIDKLSKDKKKIRFVDIGTGSGIIGITFALELDNQNIKHEGTLLDISKEAVKIAKKNLNKHNLEEKIGIAQSDLLEIIVKNKTPQSEVFKFDVIFANLPYIPSHRIKKLNKSVKDFEPIIALDGGKDGMDYIITLLNQTKKILEPDSLIILEVDDTHNNKIIEKYKKELEEYSIEILNDDNGKNRYWLVKLKVKRKK